jgi:hypothetical protein
MAIYIIGCIFYDQELSGKTKLAFIQRWAFNYNISTNGAIFIKKADGTNFDILGVPEVDGGPPRVWIILNSENNSDLYPHQHVYLYPNNAAYALSCEYVNKLQGITEIKPHVRIYLDSNCRVGER